MIDLLHQHGIGVILDWVPSHFPSDEHGLGVLRRHAPVRARRPAPGLPSRLGELHLQLRPQRGPAASCSRRATHWLDRYHADGLRVDAVASMLYLDYSRKAGEWIPNELGGRENLRRGGVPPSAEHGRLREPPGRADRSPRSRRRGRWSRGPSTSAGSGSA